MLNKNICIKCYEKYNSVPIIPEGAEAIWCYAELTNIKMDSEIPIDCVYKLEQLLKENNQC
jgi:hypothetical protein